MCDGHGEHCCCDHQSSCDCGGDFDRSPCFWTNDEKIAWLEGYLENLQAGAKSIEKRIATLKEES